MAPDGSSALADSKKSACGSALASLAAMARSPIEMMPLLSPPSTRLIDTPGLAASKAGATVLVQKSRILVSELVYQSIRPVSAKARRGIRAMPAAVPAAEIIKVRRFILLSHLDDSRRASTLLPILEVAHRPMAEGRIQNGMY